MEKSFSSDIDVLENLFISIRDSEGNFFWHCPAECGWGLTMNVADEYTDTYDPPGKVNKSAYKFLKRRYDGDSLLEDLLLLFEYLGWIRSGCLKKRLRTPKGAGLVQILEKHSLFRSRRRRVDKARLKNRLYEAQRERCAGCGIRLPKRFFDLDHIWPESKGGELFLGNVQLLCTYCNRSRKAMSWVEFVYTKAKDLRSDMRKFERDKTEPLF